MVVPLDNSFEDYAEGEIEADQTLLASNNLRVIAVSIAAGLAVASSLTVTPGLA